MTDLDRRSSPDTVSLAPWLTRTLAMFEATQWKTPLSSARSPVICKTPLGSNVYLLGEGTETTSSHGDINQDVGTITQPAILL